MNEQQSDPGGKVRVAITTGLITLVAAVIVANIQWFAQRDAARAEAENRLLLKGLGSDQNANVAWIDFLLSSGLIQETEKLRYFIDNPDEVPTIGLSQSREPQPAQTVGPNTSVETRPTDQYLARSLSSLVTADRLTAFSHLRKAATEDEDRAHQVVEEVTRASIDGYLYQASTPNGLFNSIVLLNSLPDSVWTNQRTKELVTSSLSNLLTSAKTDQVNVGERTRTQIRLLQDKLQSPTL